MVGLLPGATSRTRPVPLTEAGGRYLLPVPRSQEEQTFVLLGLISLTFGAMVLSLAKEQWVPIASFAIPLLLGSLLLTLRPFLVLVLVQAGCIAGVLGVNGANALQVSVVAGPRRLRRDHDVRCRPQPAGPDGRVDADRPARPAALAERAAGAAVGLVGAGGDALGRRRPVRWRLRGRGQDPGRRGARGRGGGRVRQGPGGRHPRAAAVRGLRRPARRAAARGVHARRQRVPAAPGLDRGFRHRRARGDHARHRCLSAAHRRPPARRAAARGVRSLAGPRLLRARRSAWSSTRTSTPSAAGSGTATR